jgi:uncharacterized protein YacL
MVSLFGLEFSNFQFFLIVVLILTLIFGPLGMIKAKKKREEEERMMMNSYSSGDNSNVSDDSVQISENEKIAKEYILQYKSTYPKESIKQALIQNGNLEDDVNKWLEKYF